MQNSGHYAQLTGWSRLHSQSTRESLCGSCACVLSGACVFSKPLLCSSSLLFITSSSERCWHLYVHILKNNGFSEEHSGCLLIATQMDLQFSSYSAFVLSIFPFWDISAPVWMNCSTIFKSMHLGDISALKHRIRGLGLAFNYQHLVLHNISILCVTIGFSLVGVSQVLWKLLILCVFLWFQCKAKLLQSSDEANGFK